MKSRPVSREEMESKHVARFKNLKSTGAGSKTDGGPIPKGAYEMLAARTAYVVTAPGDDNSPWDAAPVETPGFVSIIAECEPGEGPSLHMHDRTWETFMALTGRWSMQWGEEGEEEIILEPYDTLAYPPEVCRTFKNISDEKAYILVLVSGGVHDMDDLSFLPERGEKIAEIYGEDVKRRAEEIGFRFNAGVESGS
ncbi:MAG: cupin domain-containing protein [Proteobacteria bacterium]|nr:cupin domain-containing protein [Pseudomonadota bacterium]